MAMALPRWYTDQDKTQSKRRKWPLIIIGLILAFALFFKLAQYAQGHFPVKIWGSSPPTTDGGDAYTPYRKPHGHKNKNHDKSTGYLVDSSEYSDGDNDNHHTAQPKPTPSQHNEEVDDALDDLLTPTPTASPNPDDHDDHDAVKTYTESATGTFTPAVTPTVSHDRPGRQPRIINEWITYKTEAFTGPNVTFVRNGTTAPGYFFTCPRSLIHRMSAPMILDGDGGLIWRGPTGESTNMKVQMLNGKPYLTYWRSMRDFIIGHEYGSAHILNSSYQEVFTICPRNMNIVTNDNHKYPCVLDMHVLTLTDRGTILATAYNITTADLSNHNGTEDGWVYESQFHEIDIETNEIVFSWKSLEHQDQLPVTDSKLPLNSKPGQKKTSFKGHPYDYFHINAVEVLDDGYLVNSRNMWNIFKINKTGHVEWRLNGEDGGDFTISDDLYFSWQHDARVINRTDTGLYISMFNNDFSFVEKAVNVSEALTVYVDLEKRHAEVSRTLKDEVEHIYSLAMGNNQLLPNDHVLLNYGFGGTFKEFDEHNNLVLTGHFGSGSNRSYYSTYNMYRMDGWHGEPAAPPKVFAEYVEEKNQTTVWMSWNGATDYDHWTVYAGHDWIGFKVSESKIERTGFETSKVLDGKWEWIQAEAWTGSNPIRNSSATETHVWKAPVEYDQYLYDDPKAPTGQKNKTETDSKSNR